MTRTPWLFRLPLPWLLALRYLKSARREAFVSFLSAVATGGIALGVAALILALAALTGFQEALRSEILARTPHLEVTLSPGADPEAARRALRALPGVEEVQVLARGRGWVVGAGRVRFSTIKDNAPLKAAFTSYYRDRAGPTEQHEMEVVDLDTMFLQTLIQARGEDGRLILGRTVHDHLEHGHRTLRWLTKAPYNPRNDDAGVEAYLRQYAVAELFTESMIAHLSHHYAPESGEPSRALTSLLRDFIEGLGQIGDDFCVGLIRIEGSRPRLR